MGRIVALAGIGVLGALIALWFMIGRDEPAAPASTPGTRAPAVQPPAAPGAVAEPARPRAGARGGLPALRRPPSGSAPEAAAPGAAPAVEVPDRPKVVKPELYKALKRQVSMTEPDIVECNERATKAGKRLDGLAAYGFKLMRKGDHVVVDSTHVEYSGLEHPASDDCMREAARKMVFEELPEGVTSVQAFRKVTYKDGALVENWMSFYATDPPTPTPYDAAAAPAPPTP